MAWLSVQVSTKKLYLFPVDDWIAKARRSGMNMSWENKMMMMEPSRDHERVRARTSEGHELRVRSNPTESWVRMAHYDGQRTDEVRQSLGWSERFQG